MTTIQNTTRRALDFSQQQTSSEVFLRSPLLTSHTAGWRGIHLEYHHQSPYQKPESYSVGHLIFIHTTPSSGVCVIDGHLSPKQVACGDISIIPAYVPYQAESYSERKFIILSLEPTQFSRVVCESVDPDQVELSPVFSQPDPLIYQIGLALKTQLEADGAGSRLYAETMANALAVHLLKHYTSQKITVGNYSGALTRANLNQVIDYIDTSLDQDLSLNEMAAIVQMSPTYFASLFKRSTGISPHKYVIKHRVERAKLLLLSTDLTISEIASQVGFASQSHLTQQFKRLITMTPKQIRSDRSASGTTSPIMSG